MTSGTAPTEYTVRMEHTLPLDTKAEAMKPLTLPLSEPILLCKIEIIPASPYSKEERDTY